MGVTGWGGAVTLYVEMDFGQGVVDHGTPPSPTGTAIWDDGAWDASTWSGRSPQWTDVTDDVRGLETHIGFSRQTNRYTTATATVTLNNIDGRYSVVNTLGPHYGHIAVLRQGRIRATYDSGSDVYDFVLFTGIIQTWEQQYPGIGTDRFVQVQLVGLESQIANTTRYATGAIGAGDNASERISRILTSAGWSGPTSLDPGETTFQATTLEGSAMNELQLVADSEGGYFYWTPDGVATYDGYNAQVEKGRLLNPVLFADYDSVAAPIQFSDIRFAYNGDLVVNVINYENVGGTLQQVTSPNSRSLYGDRLSTRTDLIGQSDDHALRMARRDLQVYQNPEFRVDALTFTPMAAANDVLEQRGYRAWYPLATGLLGLRMGVQVDITPPGETASITRLCFVESISHRIGADNTWDVTLEFSSATAYADVGTSVFAPFSGADGVWNSSRWGW